MGKPPADIPDLPLGIIHFALQLFINLISHAQSAGSHRMAKALQSSVGINRQTPGQLKESRLYIIPGAAARTEAKVFINRQFGN